MDQNNKWHFRSKRVCNNLWWYRFIICATGVIFTFLSSGSVLSADNTQHYQSSVSKRLSKVHKKNRTKLGTRGQISGNRKRDAFLLDPETVWGRQLGIDKIHIYRIPLDVRYYVRVQMNPKGIEATLTLFAPDGTKLEEVDTPQSTEAVKSIIWTSETSGDYRLEVRARKKIAPEEYSIAIRRFLPITEQNMSAIIADRAMAEGWRLHEIGTEEALRQAIDKLTEAITNWQAAGNSREEATALMYLGEVYHLLSEYEKALEVYNRVLPIWETVPAEGINEGRGWAYNNMGSSYKAMGDLQKSLDNYIRSLHAYRAQAQMNARPYSRGEGIALTGMGGIYASLGEPQKAIPYLIQAILHLRFAKDASIEARARHRLGEAYALSGNHQKAVRCYVQALHSWRAAADRQGQVRVLNSLGKAYIQRGEYQKALVWLNEALQIGRTTGERQYQANTLTCTGQVYYALNQTQESLDHLAQALQIYKEVNDPIGEADALYNVARVKRKSGSFDDAHSTIGKVIGIVESVRARVVTQELRASYLSTVRSYYEFYVDLLMEMDSRNPSVGYAGKALQISERARARSLIEALMESQADIRQGVNPELLKRERDVQQRLNAKTNYQMRPRRTPLTEEQASELTREIDALSIEYQQIQAQIRTNSPSYSALTQPQSLSLQEIQQQILDEDTLLLEYMLGDERSFLWAVTPTSITTFTLPKRADIEASARRFYSTLTSSPQQKPFKTTDANLARLARLSNEYPNAAAALSRTVLKPVAQQLGKKRLLIVAEGALQYVPFAALPVPDSDKQVAQTSKGSSAAIFRPLIVEQEIINLPSISSLAVLRQEVAGRANAPKKVAVLADPVFDADDPRLKSKDASSGRPDEKTSRSKSLRTLLARNQIRAAVERSARDVGITENGRLRRLPSTRQEAIAITSLVPESDSMLALDFAANHATATSTELSQYRIVHFATHGMLNSEHPELSGIVLSLVNKQGEDQDGFLRTHEVYNLKLPADLVVLSACQTALGKEIKGEGLVGLTRGFMYAGAARVASSLWKVDSTATAALMTRFYEGMLKEGLTPPAALRSAQMYLWKETKWKSPYYWASFVIQGEWK